MSSVSRSYNPVKAETKFVPIKSLTFYNGNHYVLVPFTVINGSLDFITTDTGFTPSNGDGNSNGHSWRMVKPMGGQQEVTSLSSNFKTWFENFEGGVDTGSVSIFIAPVMTKVQMTVPSGDSILNSQYCYRSGLSEAPSSDEFVTGNDNNEYNSVWVFKTPLVVKYTSSGTTYYASLYTQFTNPN
jgi:hypothetical protein